MATYPSIIVRIDEHELVPVMGTSNESSTRVHHSKPNVVVSSSCSETENTNTHVRGNQNGSETTPIL